MISDKALQKNGIFILAVTKEAFESIVTRMEARHEPKAPDVAGFGSDTRELPNAKIQCDMGNSPRHEERKAQPPNLSRNTWIFQSTGKYYRLRAALRELEELIWRVSRFKKEIRAGDRIYFWEAGANGGIVGVGEVAESPRVQPCPAEELPFIRQMEKFRGDELRVKVTNVHRIQAKIPKTHLQSRPGLESLSILKQPRGTNFRVSPNEAEALEAVLGSYMITPTLKQKPCREKRIVLKPV